MPTLIIGKTYLNGKKDIVTITGAVGPNEPGYELGHRFVDQYGVGYTEDGMFNKNNPSHAFNLVGELPDSATTAKEAVEQPGFFTHLGNKMRDNPFKTMLGLTVAAGVGYVVYDSAANTNDNVGDAGEVAAAFVAAWA